MKPVEARKSLSPPTPLSFLKDRALSETNGKAAFRIRFLRVTELQVEEEIWEDKAPCGALFHIQCGATIGAWLRPSSAQLHMRSSSPFLKSHFNADGLTTSTQTSCCCGPLAKSLGQNMRRESEVSSIPLVAILKLFIEVMKRINTTSNFTVVQWQRQWVRISGGLKFKSEKALWSSGKNNGLKLKLDTSSNLE
ncbi:uncharacterized protein LOC144093124 [Stigmatopora argus]